MLKVVLATATALACAAPAHAASWPKQDWYVMRLTAVSPSTPPSLRRDGGAYPPALWMTSGDGRLGGPAPGGGRTVALDAKALSRDGRVAEVRYFVWPQDRSSITEVTSRIDCAKTGETVLSWRRYDADFQPVAAGDQGFRRIDRTSLAVANTVCAAAKKGAVSGKSLPEIVSGG